MLYNAIFHIFYFKIYGANPFFIFCFFYFSISLNCFLILHFHYYMGIFINIKNYKLIMYQIYFQIYFIFFKETLIKKYF